MKEAETGIAGGAGRPSRRERALRELDRIARDCGAGDWNGEGAIGVTEEVVEEARKFVAVLPEDCLPNPEEDVDALPNGDVALDWYKDNNMFMVGIGKGGRIAYSGLFGDGERCRGYAGIVDGGVPASLLAFIRRVL